MRSLNCYCETNLSTPDNRTGTALYYLGKIRFGKSNIRAAIEYLEKALPHFQGDSEGLRLSRLRTMALLVQSYDIKKESERVDELVQRIGLETRVNDDQEPEALIVVNPEYPEQYHRAGIEGYVVVEFSIDDKGRVVNLVAIESVSKYRYAPRYVDGRPVFVHGVSVRVEFEKKR